MSNFMSYLFLNLISLHLTISKPSLGHPLVWCGWVYQNYFVTLFRADQFLIEAQERRWW